MILNLLFWLLLFTLFYTYIGYALVLYLLLKLKNLFSNKKRWCPDKEYEPEVCLFVTAYNEKDYVDQKVENSFSLDYPKDKIQYLWITDGSDDGTPELLKKYPGIEVHHSPERKGKMHAMNRGVKFVRAPIIIFSDTNTNLGKASIREIVAKFSNPKTGCVAGEKRIVNKQSDVAAGAGEGLYWKIESWIKNMDAELNTAVGAAGELFAIRTDLFEDVEPDTLIDDFLISLRIAQKGFHIAYTPNAYSEEAASLNVKEEMKRKVRIAAGGVQTIFRLKSLLNPFKFGLLSWQYFSHKVLRWTLAPVSLFLLLPINVLIVLQGNSWGVFGWYSVILYFQIICYLFAVVGWFLENRRIRFKGLFMPYYFVSINYAAVRGIFRYFKGKQSVNWERAKRANS